jgi:hypothetical protein
MGGNSSLT